MSLLPNRNTENDLFNLSGSVGRFGDNDRADVIKAQALLANAGYYNLPEPGVPTGWPGSELDRALIRFQKDNDACPDGLMLPLAADGVSENGVGETLQALRGDVGNRLHGYAAPTPQQVDRFYDEWMRERGAENAPRTDTPILMRKDGGAQPHGVVPQTMSDADPPAPLPFKPGERHALLPALAIPAAEAIMLYGLPAAAAGYVTYKAWQDRPRDKSGAPPFPADAAPKPAPLPGPPPEPVKPVQTPPSIKPNVGPQNEALIPPDLSKWIGELPPQEQPFANDLTGIILERNDHGSRGKPETELANRIMVRACLAELKAGYPEMADRIKHFAGAYREGVIDESRNDLGYLKEEVVRSKSEKGRSNRPDASFGAQDNPQHPYSGRMNTVDVKKLGSEHDEMSLTANEARRYEKLKGNIETGVTGWARKMKPGESEAEYASYVTLRCRAMWDDLDAKLRKDGFLPAR